LTQLVRALNEIGLYLPVSKKETGHAFYIPSFTEVRNVGHRCWVAMLFQMP